MATDYKAVEWKIQNAVQEIRNGKGSLYDIAIWCLTLFSESRDYAAEIGIPDEEVVGHINRKFLRDYAVDLEGLLVVLKRRPERDQWNRPILDLLEDVRSEIDQERDQDGGDKPARRSATVKQVQELQAAIDENRLEIARLEERVRELDSENQDLKRLNATLEGRIHELERLLDREGSISRG